MAERFHRGGRLVAFGVGTAAADAAHVVVEFVHPVIVGKRALPAAALPGGQHPEDLALQLGLLADPGDIALAVSPDGNCPGVAAALAAGRDAGLLTVALLGGDGGAAARVPGLDHVLIVDSDDLRVVREGHVTAYHVLWELVHVFLDHPGALA